jgi:hypothetical protein
MHVLGPLSPAAGTLSRFGTLTYTTLTYTVNLEPHQPPVLRITCSLVARGNR